MSFKRDLFHFLRGVAKRSGAGISWGYSPDESGYPRIVLRRTGGHPEMHTRGESGMTSSDVQIACYAVKDQGRSAAKRAGQLADGVRAALSGFVGPMGETFIYSAHMREQFDAEEQPLAKGDWVLGVIQEYEIVHGESVGATT